MHSPYESLVNGVVCPVIAQVPSGGGRWSTCTKGSQLEPCFDLHFGAGTIHTAV